MPAPGDGARHARADPRVVHVPGHSKSVPPDTPVRALVALDESFHLQIADMAANAELRRMLASLNERIRFIRWIDMETVGRDSTQKEHHQIARALKARDRAAGEKHLGAHIGLRREQIVEAITRGLARIYLVEGNGPRDSVTD